MATEICKSFTGFNPDFMKPYFTIKMVYNLRHGCTLKLTSVISRYSGINSVLFRSCLLWTRLPVSIKRLNLNLNWELQEILSVLEQYDFVIMNYEQYQCNYDIHNVLELFL